jgi:heme/copper-type cytochrome/quinol oxidase subunit 3
MQIPYTVENHPETGVYNGKLGVWLFLASEVMLFGALFSSYILLRTNAEHWPHGVEEGLSIPLATVNTMVLIGSSVTMVMAWAAARLRDLKKFRLYMGITFLCALVFLGIKYVEYADKFHHGHFPSHSTFLAIYFTLTGLHGLHVIGGMIVNGYLWGPGVKLFHRDPARFANRVEVAGLYWHFVDLVWIFLFPVLYLL